MNTMVLKSDAARLKWRQIMNAAREGRDTVIEHYATPTAAVIPYKDYKALEDELDDLRAGRRAAAILEEIERDPSRVEDYEDVRKRWIAEGSLDE